MNKNKIILIGGGGHCKSVIDVIEQENKFEIAGIVDAVQKYSNNVSGYKILWNDEEIDELVKQNFAFCITIGQIKSAQPRVNLYNRLKILNARLPVIASPIAYVSKNSFLGEGTIIMHHVLINSGVKVGVNCIINTKSLLEHEVTVGHHCHISTAAVLNGKSSVEDEVFIGSNTVVNNNVKIFGKCIIGSGSTVNKDINSSGVYVGNCIKQIK